MKHISVLICLASLFISSCGASPTIAPTVDVGQIQTSAVKTAVALVTLNAPTLTPVPTNTPSPTRTPLPTATFTPAPQPIILTGNGDSIVDLNKWDGAAILHAKYIGGGNFIVRNYPASSNDYMDLLVNTIGSYEGTLLLDPFDNQPQTARFEVKASGSWELQVLPFTSIRKEIIPGVIQGIGDDVIFINGGNKKPDILKADASQASRNFIVSSYGATSHDLVINKIAPYTGTTILDPGTFLIVVKATGPWLLDITTK